MKKNKHGGKRKDSGRHQKYNEKTTTISFRCPESKEGEMRLFIEEKLTNYKIISSPAHK